jgi:hypothetical protein
MQPLGDSRPSIIGTTTMNMQVKGTKLLIEIDVSEAAAAIAIVGLLLVVGFAQGM